MLIFPSLPSPGRDRRRRREAGEGAGPRGDQEADRVLLLGPEPQGGQVTRGQLFIFRCNAASPGG